MFILLFLVSKKMGGVEEMKKKNEKQGDFLRIKSWLLLQKNLILQPKLSRIGIYLRQWNEKTNASWD